MIECIYDDVKRFSEGLAAIKENDTWGFIDKNGNKKISCIYSSAYLFSEGLVGVGRNDKFGFIDNYE